MTSNNHFSSRVLDIIGETQGEIEVIVDRLSRQRYDEALLAAKRALERLRPLFSEPTITRLAHLDVADTPDNIQSNASLKSDGSDSQSLTMTDIYDKLMNTIALVPDSVKVFVSVPHKKHGKVWKRVRVAKADPRCIIRCDMCDKPAVVLDHLWPYHSEMNRCSDHRNTMTMLPA